MMADSYAKRVTKKETKRAIRACYTRPDRVRDPHSSALHFPGDSSSLQATLCNPVCLSSGPLQAAIQSPASLQPRLPPCMWPRITRFHTILPRDLPIVERTISNYWPDVATHIGRVLYGDVACREILAERYSPNVSVPFRRCTCFSPSR